MRRSPCDGPFPFPPDDRSQGSDPASVRAFVGAPPPLPGPGLLPLPLNRFFGRVTELAELPRMLADSRLVTLSGAAGVGKSRLALECAGALQNRYANGAHLVELATVRDPDLVEHALAEALGITDQTPRPARTVLLDHLSGRRLLLVLDGYEHIVDACAEVVADLLRHAPGLTVLAAGRRPLRLASEAVLPLDPLPVADAVLLFADRAARVLPGFRLSDGHEDSVRELCRRLDGIPLALELAAGRLPVLSVNDIVARLDDRFRLLTGGTRGALPRHRTLRTAVGWSHELCTPRERLLWARLSVFAGPFDLEAVEYVCSGTDLPADAVLDVVGELLAQSVLTREETPAGVRYRMLDTLRAYGHEWLAALGDVHRVRRRHRDWYVGLATFCELDWFSPRQAEVAALAEGALPNLRAALELCLESDEEVHLGQYLAGTLWFYWVGCGRLAEGRHWLQGALAGDGAHQDSRLKALWVLGYVATLQGDAAAGAGALHECREEAAAAGSARATAYAVHRTGCLALLSGELVRAEDLLRGALASYRELGELNSQVLMGQVELAMSLAFQDRLAEAEELCEEVREVCEERGELWARAYALYVLAYAAWTRGETAAARGLLVTALGASHRFHDLVGLVLALELLALVTVDEGDAAEAAVLQGAATPVWDAVGLPLFGSRHFGAPRALAHDRALAALGTDGYRRHAREGRALPLEAAVRRALGTQGPAGSPAEDGGGETAG